MSDDTTTTLRIVSEEDGIFGFEPRGSGAVAAPLRRWDAVHARTSEAAIVRLGPGRGYVINEGPGTVRVRYEARGRLVGPIADFLRAGECRELGIGKRVAWRMCVGL